MRRRWAVRARVCRYPFALQEEIASLSPLLLLQPVELDEVVGEVSKHWTRGGAARHAARLNRPPSVMWRAVVERAEP